MLCINNIIRDLWAYDTLSEMRLGAEVDPTAVTEKCISHRETSGYQGWRKTPGMVKEWRKHLQA